MSCINVKVTAEPSIVASATLLGPTIIVTISNVIDSLNTVIHRIGGINLSTRSLNHELRMKCGIVCSIDLAHKYIVVDEGPIWLTQLNNYSSDVVVYSNTEWRIEY